jgi:hypothetical protein
MAEAREEGSRETGAAIARSYGVSQSTISWLYAMGRNDWTAQMTSLIRQQVVKKKAAN